MSLTAGGSSPRQQQARAEYLTWQNQARLAVLLVLAVVGAGLRALGALALPALPPSGGVRLTLALLLAVAYAAAILVVQRRLARTGAAGTATVVAVFAADLAVVYGATYLLIPPAHYVRALIVAIASLQLTHMYFSRRGASLLLGAVVALHVFLLAIADARAGAVGWAEELWTLTLFGIVGAGLVALQGEVASRLDRLTELFERAQEGDFLGEYVEVLDHRPDGITRAGRAYNRMRTQLATIVLTDPLSGCLNRRGFDQAMARELARSARANAELAVLAVDVDYFKLINDTFGHLAGDAVITEIGLLLRENARAGDVVARIGGEEFMILAPDTNVAGAYNLATRILESFRRHRFQALEGRLPVTASIGVTSDRARDESMAEDLRARADEALYAAKRGGRNRVALWTHGSGDRAPLSRADAR
jgi:diguanylate cyclase (GGDEF)-like protein